MYSCGRAGGSSCPTCLETDVRQTCDPVCVGLTVFQATPCRTAVAAPCWFEDAPARPIPERQADLVAAAVAHCPAAFLDLIRSSTNTTLQFASWDSQCHAHRRVAHQRSIWRGGRDGKARTRFNVSKPPLQVMRSSKSLAWVISTVFDRGSWVMRPTGRVPIKAPTPPPNRHAAKIGVLCSSL